MGKYLVQKDLENKLSPDTIAKIFGDGDNGEINADAVDAVIDDAEAEAESFLVGFVELPLKDPHDRLMKLACRDFAMAFSFERHPEYVRSFGEEKRAERWKRGIDRMLRIQKAMQRLSDNEAAKAGPPADVGGKVGAIGRDTCPVPPRRTFGNSGDW